MSMTYDELRKSLKGPVHLVMTPVTKEEEIDFECLKELIGSISVRNSTLVPNSSWKI